MPDRIRPRHPSIASDDVVVLRTGGSNSVYHLHAKGLRYTPDRFSSFESAAVKGDELARQRCVRLFYIDSPNGPPDLLHDYRHT